MCTSIAKLTIVLVAYVICVKCASKSQPNIVVIMADDMGWNDVGFHGSNQIPTPNIDALAYNGVILNRHYTMQICTPSRAAFLTGKYPIRTGMQGYPLKAGEPRGLPLEEVTLPQRLKQLGYVTRLVGKWHQGNFRTEYTPTRRGFDSFLGYWNGYNGYFNDRLKENGREGFNFRRDLCTTQDYIDMYATEVFTKEAEDIIGKHDTARPLFLQIAHLAVHTGNDDMPLEVPDPKEAHEKFNYIDSPERRLYAAMVGELDESVGRVVKALTEKEILNNTIIVFMSDNGAPTTGGFAPNSGSNWPLRGMKFTLHEGGVRNVAAIWSSSFQAPGRVSSQLIHLIDWLPTLYSAAGGNVSDLGILDGIDQWDSLVSSTPQVKYPRTQLLLNIDDVENMEALINGTFKITRGDYKNGVLDGYYGDDGRGPENPLYNISGILLSKVNTAFRQIDVSRIDEYVINDLRVHSLVHCPLNKRDENRLSEFVYCVDYCLYDIQNDPCEMNNLAVDNIEIVKDLVMILNKLKGEAVPQLNKPVDPAANPSLHNGTWVSWLDDPSSKPDECNLPDDHYNLLFTGIDTVSSSLRCFSSSIYCVLVISGLLSYLF